MSGLPVAGRTIGGRGIAGAALALLALLLPLASCRSAGAGSGPGTCAPVALGPYLVEVGPGCFRVLWETSDPVPTRLSWGTERHGENHFGSDEPVTRHDVLVEGLLPGSVAWYRLEGEAAEAIPVRIPPVSPRSVRIAVVGDTHGTAGVHARIVREIVREEPDLLLHTGDLSLRPGKHEGDVEKEFFRVEGPLLRSVPVVPVLGNHDGNGSRFVELFVRPRGEGEETYYLVRRGPLALVALDTNESVSAESPQGLWLARTLESLDEDPGVVFRVVAMHWGPFDSGSGHGSNPEARDALVPLFERHNVDLVFSGHDHTYERGTVRGVRYVVTGGGGGGRKKPHEVLGGAWTEASSSKPHHGLVEVDGRELRFTAREAGSGRLLDELRIVREPADAPGRR